MRKSLVVVPGVDRHAMDSAMVALSWDAPRAVAVGHHIDPVTQVLSRVVSDRTGVLDRADVGLEHACVSGALREDILPTLERLAREGCWDTIVAGLPIATAADQLSAALPASPVSRGGSGRCQRAAPPPSQRVDPAPSQQRFSSPPAVTYVWAGQTTVSATYLTVGRLPVWFTEATSLTR